MAMELQNSAEPVELEKADTFKKNAKIDLNRLEQFGFPEDVLMEFRMRKMAAETLIKIEAATGQEIQDVAIKGLNPQIAAFVETTTGKISINATTLADPKLALHALRHEHEHKLTNIFHLNLSQITPTEQDILCQELGLKELDQTALIEGFNELSTFDKHGENDQSGYAKKEVPMAKKLDDLSKTHLKKSLLATFRSGNAELLIIQLKQLATILQVKQGFKNFN